MPQVQRAGGQAEVRVRELPDAKLGRRQNQSQRARIQMAFSSRQLHSDATSSLGGTSFTFVGSSAPSTVDTGVELESAVLMFPSIQTPVIVDPCRKPSILRQVCSIDLTVAGAVYESGSSGEI